MSERHFTLTEATELLPTVRPLVEQLALAQAEVIDPERRLKLSMLTEANGSTAGVEPLLRPAQDVVRLAAELDDLGIVIRDPLSGLIDFPSERDGEEIYLCWRLGEDTIAHWHDPDSGFQGRQPL